MNDDKRHSVFVKWLQDSLDRIYGLIDQLGNLTLRSPPNKSKSVRYCVFAICFVSYMIVIIIPIAMIMVLEFILLIVYMDGMAVRGHPPRPPLTSYLIQKVEISNKVAEGGRKGGSASAKSRSSNANERNEKILADAKKLLCDGRARHELAGILVRRYAGTQGYPRTNAQYRNILRPLKEKKNEN